MKNPQPPRPVEILSFFATTAKGMEELLLKELQDLGAEDAVIARAGVSFRGSLELGYRALLWSRIANRILLPLRSFSAETPERLYGGVKTIRWADHMTVDNTLAVDYAISKGPGAARDRNSNPSLQSAAPPMRRRPGVSPVVALTGVGSPVRQPERYQPLISSFAQAPRLSQEDAAPREIGVTHTHFGALKVKDAICDQFRNTQGARPSVDSDRPDIRINVYVDAREHSATATVSIDLSGSSLHLRGYREQGAAAPLKENLAAAILMQAGWPEAVAAARTEGRIQDLAFLDPMCGSGTLPLEAAMMAARIAPGLKREYYGFQAWQGHKPALWKRLVEEARSAEITDQKNLPKIVGTDQDFKVVRVAIANSERAGLTTRVHFEKRELTEAESIAPKGIVAMNPPYGERMGDVENLKPLYKQMGDIFKQKFKGWTGFIFTGTPELAKSVGLHASRRFVLYNGALECRLLRFELYAGSAGAASRPADHAASS